MGKGTWPNPWDNGTFAARPSASAVGYGAYYLDDDGVLWQSDGASTWTEVRDFSATTVSYGSNASYVAEIAFAGSSNAVARADHYHGGVNSVTASSSNTLQRGVFNLRAGNNISFGLTNTDGDAEFDTLTIHGAAAVGGGSSSLTVEEVDGSPTDSAVTKIVFPNGTLGIASHVATYTPAGGGGSLTQAYAGYNTAGGSWDTTAANNRGYAKSITLANDCLITSIGAYCQTASTTTAGGPHVALYTDSGGAPSLLIGEGRGMASVFLTGTTPRWIEVPLGVWVPAGTYWIAVQVSAVGFGVILQVAYDGSGSDKSFAGADNQFIDWASLTSSGTSNKYSLRANTIR